MERKDFLIVLASGSPRRKELLKKAGFQFAICPAEGEERTDAKDPQSLVEALSDQKASEVYQRLRPKKRKPILVIGADTVVALDQTVLGKPHTPEKAVEMLKMLSGKAHHVYTGVTVIASLGQKKAPVKQTFHEDTEVIFKALSDSTIRTYVSTGEPLDKAGAYGIQGKGGALVKQIRGDYDNVVGLPVTALSAAIDSLLSTLE